MEPRNPGTFMRSSSGAAGPASTSKILWLGRPALSRAASAEPAVPPPTTIYCQTRLSVALIFSSQNMVLGYILRVGVKLT